MKRVIALTMLVAMHLMAFSQAPNATVKWGDLGKEKFFKTGATFSILGQLDNTIVVAKYQGKNSSYLIYDANLKYIKHVDFGKAYTGWTREMANDGNYFTGNKAFQVYRENRFAEDGTTPTYLAELDLNTMKHKEKVTVGVRRPNKPYQWNFMGYYIRQSADGTKFAFLGNEREFRLMDSDNEYDFQIIVFDTNLKKIQEKTWKYPLEANKVIVENMVVDNDGNVFVQAKVKSKEWKKKTGLDDQLILVSSPVVGETNHISFDESAIMSSLELVALGGGKIVGGGLGFSGTYFLSFDANNPKNVVIKYSPFSEKLMAGMVVGIKKNSLSYIYLDKVEVTADGGLLVICEQRIPPYNTPNGVAKPGEANDILIFRYNDTGKIVWETNILKRQKMNSIGDFSEKHYSYIHSFDGQTIRLLFNDDALNINNFDPSKVAMCKGFNDATAVLAEVDAATGSYKKAHLFKATEKGVILYPLASEAIEPNRFIVFGGDITGGKIASFRIGEITIK